MLNLKPLTLDTELQNNVFNAKDHFARTIIDVNKDVKRPPLAVSIGYDDKSYGGVYYPLKFASKGNISMIAGQEKSRKTFFKSLLESNAIGGTANNYTSDIEIKGYLEDNWIISIDSEQSEYDATQTAKRVPFMCGSIPNNYLALQWREYNTQERKQLLEWLFMESEYRNNLGWCIIDGIVDFISDFNDAIESKEITEKLMKYTTLTKAAVTCMLHLNPGSEKLRGHLGTILGQKCEMVSVVQNEGEYSKVKCTRVRGGKPFKDFSIRIDNDWMPYISDDLHKLEQNNII